jgi:hypothetical protein
MAGHFAELFLMQGGRSAFSLLSGSDCKLFIGMEKTFLVAKRDREIRAQVRLDDFLNRQHIPKQKMGSGFLNTW